jgi:hypothetical protein
MKFKVASKKSLMLIIFFTICISVGIFVFASASGYLSNTSSNPKNELIANSDIKLRAIEVGKEPELIKAYGIDGTIGYVLSTDLMGVQPKNPKEALELQAKDKNGREIPLYDASGEKVIGKFRIGP